MANKAIFRCITLLLIFWSTRSLYAQTTAPAKTTASVVTGRVVNDSGKVMPSVSVLEKGTANGVMTNDEGRFSIQLKGASRTLIFSSSGFVSTTVRLQNDRNLEVKLAPMVNPLEEVVVIGYGQMKKGDLTGAVASVSMKDLENRPVTNIGQALQGEVANLNVTQNYSGGGAPNAQQNINIRGYTGFGVSSGPLIVVDGVPGGDLNSINLSDVASITVLKDAASSAIYGSSAPYGVLLITTKQGKKGGRPSISYNDNLSMSQVINLPKMIDSWDFANIYNEAFVNAGRAPWFNDETLGRIKAYMDGQMKEETIKDPNQDDWYGSGIGYFTGAGPNFGNGNNDWFKIYFRPWAFTQQHNLGISGGSNNSTYYLGAGYLTKEGMYNFMADRFSRYNLKANISTTVSKWLTVNFRSGFSRETNNTPATYPDATGGNYMHQIARKLPTTPLKNPDGYYSDYSNVNLFTQGGRDTYTDNKALMTGEVVVKPLPGWSITGNFTYDGRFYNDQDFNKVVYSILPSGNKVVEFQTNPNNSLEESSSVTDHYVTNLYSSYEKKVGKHSFQALGGYIKEYKNYRLLSAGNSLLYSNDVPSLNLTYNTTPSVGDNNIALAIEGFFGRLNYNYDEKYLLEVNGRYDASSRFLAGKRWNLYPSVSAGYVISKEQFWRPIQSAINSLKVRGSYGSLGDQWGDDPTQSQYYPFYPSLGTTAPSSTNWLFSDGRQAYVSPPSLVNPQLTWATIKTLDLGMDAALLKSRLSLSFDWYDRNADNFVGPAQSLPSVLGTAVPNANNASMETKGFDLSIGWNDRVGQVNYSVRGVLSNYKGKVLKYPNPSGLLSDWRPGMSMGEIWGYQTQGLFQNAAEVTGAPSQAKIFGGEWTPGDVRYKDLNGDHVIDYGDNTVSHPGDQKVIGDSTPRYSYGITLAASWKGFDISLFLQGVGKRDAWINSNMYWGIIGGEWQSTLMTQNLNRWTAQTPNGFFPKYYMSSETTKNEEVQSRYLQNAAYMRVKNLQLGYTLPKRWTSHAGLQNVRLYLSGDNLATFTKMQRSVDPELAEGDGKIYPLQRTFSFGLNATL